VDRAAEGDSQQREGEDRHGGDGQEDGERGTVQDGVEAGEQLSSSSSIMLRCSEWGEQQRCPDGESDAPASNVDQMNIE
jgi:hypothetical protein